MNDAIDTSQRTFEGGHVADVGDDQFRLGIQCGRPASPLMHLIDQHIQNAHPMTSIEQSTCDVAANEAGAAGYEDCFTQLTTPATSSTIQYLPLLMFRLSESAPKSTDSEGLSLAVD